MSARHSFSGPSAGSISSTINGPPPMLHAAPNSSSTSSSSLNTNGGAYLPAHMVNQPNMHHLSSLQNGGPPNAMPLPPLGGSQPPHLQPLQQQMQPPQPSLQRSAASGYHTPLSAAGSSSHSLDDPIPIPYNVTHAKLCQLSRMMSTPHHHARQVRSYYVGVMITKTDRV